MGDLSDPLGLGLAGAAQGAVGALRDIIAQRIAAQMYADKQRQQQFENALNTRRLDQADELQRSRMALDAQDRADRLAEQTRLHNQQDEEHRLTAANVLGDQLPPQTFLEPTDPAVGMLRSAGRGSLLQEQQERPAVDVGPLQPGDTGGARKQGFLKLASQKQSQDEATRQQKADELARQQARDEETTRHNRAMENKPQALSIVGVPTVDDQGNPVTRYMSKGEAVGKDFAKPAPNQLQVEGAHKKDAIDALNQLDQSINEASSLVGPLAGRETTLEQWIGSGDPRAQALGAKMLLAKMKVDAGIGGMRAAASPQVLARWDNLLSQKVTPEGLHATVQAIREILGGGSQSTPSTDKGSVKVLSIERVK